MLIQGNHIDGGAEGHNIFITSLTEGVLPDLVTVTQNRLTKTYFTTPAEDMFQVRDVGRITFTHNTCTSGLNMEQCVDLKTTTTPLLIAYNFFDGATLQRSGQGEDGAGGCMVIHESDTIPDQHRIEHNFFKYCKETIIRFAPGKEAEKSSAIVRHNLFIQRGHQESVMPLEEAKDVVFMNNTFLYGTLKLGNSKQTRLPRNTTFQNNIFYHTEIEDHTLPPEFTYHCSHNLFYQRASTGFGDGRCQNSIEADPLFVDLAQLDLRLQSESPAMGQGTDGLDIGAATAGALLPPLTEQLFLPFIRR